MAEAKTPKLPEDVANDFKYVGNGAMRYVVGGKTVNVETLTAAQASALVSAGVHFLQKKRKAKAKKTDQT
jgi:hypothetical protein